MATVYGGQGKVAGSPIPPGMPGSPGRHRPQVRRHRPPRPSWLRRSPSSATADVSAGPDRCRSASTPTPATRSPSAYMQDQWRKNLGVKSELKGETFDQFVVDRPRHVSRSPGTPGARTIRTRTTSSGRCSGARAATTTRGTRTPQFDDLVAQAGAEPDAAKSIALYNQAQELLVEDAPAVFTRWRVSQLRGRAVGPGRHRHRPGLGRHRRHVLREHLDRASTRETSAPRRTRGWDAPRPTPRPGPSSAHRRCRARVATELTTPDRRPGADRGPR